MSIRAAETQDLPAVEKIYEQIHDAEERGLLTIGWARGVYPTRETAGSALRRGDLYVLETPDGIVGAAVINRLQVGCYGQGQWSEQVPDEEVLVLHTLVISPEYSGRGYGRAFVSFYEQMAAGIGCKWLRMDTNSRNLAARRMYGRLGYREIGIVPTVFNGIDGVMLVLLEKHA